MRRSFVLALLLGACTGSRPILAIELTTDLRAGVEFTRVRTELSEEPFASGAALRVVSIDHLVDGALDYTDRARVAELDVEAGAILYARVSLLDASGRIRGQRLATIDVPASRVITIVIGAACRGVVCPGDGDPEATACVNGECVPPTCLPESPESCPAGSCTDDSECTSTSACVRGVCRDGSCLFVDDCPAGEICDADACVSAPLCGDASCDPGSETPCGCDADCGPCAGSCLDGVCEALEASTCPEDCGPPPVTCGDGVCEHAEVCEEDCASAPMPAPVCGDPGCTSCLECDACCDRGCGDGTCVAGENDACACPVDCGPCPSVCGDLRCDAGEDCPGDCTTAVVCRDGTCADGEGESCGSCQEDCGWCGFGMPAIGPDGSCVGVSGHGGALCGDLDSAWTAAGVNVAYYPMQVSTETPLISGDTWDGGGGLVLRTLPILTKVGIQSTRNPRCVESPPLRPSVEGYVFGYVRDASGLETTVGWIRAADLILDTGLGSDCADGVTGEEFQVAENPYSRPLMCEALECPGRRTCRDANPTGEGASDCGGTLVREERMVNADTLQLRYAPEGPARRYAHRGDRVRVLYRREPYAFVQVLSTVAPDLTPEGARGWVSAMFLE